MPTDLDKLQGAWRITSLELDGKTQPTSVIEDATIVVSGGSFTSTGMGVTYHGTIEVNASRSPKALDLIFTTGPQKGTRNPGIYKLSGDTWTLCLATRGVARPRVFATKADSGLALETLQREGAGAKTTARAAVKPRAGKPAVVAAPASSGPATEIEGEWAMTAGVFNGAPLDPSMVAYCTRITRGDVTTVLAGPQVMLSARFTLDPAATPRVISYVNLAGTSKGKTQAGIYERDGDTLRISMSAPGQAAPKDFTTSKGDGRTYTAWTLAKR